MTKTPKNKGGRPPVIFTTKDKERVSKLVGFGLTQAEIAQIFDCSDETLRKNCKHELNTGKTLAKEIVIGKLFGNIKKGKEASIFFYLKTQCGWRETVDVNVEQLPRLKATVQKLNDK